MYAQILEADCGTGCKKTNHTHLHALAIQGRPGKPVQATVCVW